MSDDPNYHCAHCGTTWSYRAVRYVARCRDCGSGLTRTPSTASGTMSGLPDALPDSAPPAHLTLRG